MAEILLCNSALKPEHLSQHCSINTEQLDDLFETTPELIRRYKPYILHNRPTLSDKNIAQCLSPEPISRELTHLSLSYGEEQVLALAEIIAKLKEYNIGMIGASTSVYAHRLGGFAGAVKDYQAALMSYRDARSANTATKLLAKKKVNKAFQFLQSRFRHELNAVSSQIKSRKGNPLNNPVRAMNIAKSSRSAVKLEIDSQVQAHKLAKFAQHAKYLGNGLAVIDFGSRIGNIHSSYKADGEWERDLFIESSSFALSASTGIVAVNVGTASLGLLVALTPVGWIGLIFGGVAVAGTAAGLSIALNNYSKNNAGKWYDRLMDSL